MEDTLSSAKRLAILKELVKVKPGGTIDERRRAKALLRSLSQQRDLKLKPNPRQRGLDNRNNDYLANFDKIRTRPAVGRAVVTSTFKKGPKTNKYDVSFYNYDTGVRDSPFAGGSRNAKFQGLNYMLGNAMDKDIPKNNMIKIQATDGRRVKAYERGTGGGLKFKPYPWEPDTAVGGEATTYKNKKGNFQPMVDGKFTEAKPNPGDRLRSGLIRLATSDTAKKRILKAVPAFTKGVPLVNAIMTGADIGEAMRKHLKINKSVSSRGGGRKSLND